MTPSQVNKLGEKLRTTEELTEDLLGPLQDLRAGFQSPMLRAQAIVRDVLVIDATARLKTVNSIVEKLKRERTRLSRMQDMAGLRIVVGPWRAEQDDVVGRLMTLFGKEHTKVDDRRKHPSYGYRAVHLIVQMDEHLLEIQVRTPLQDLWAQAMERLGDRLGRNIRHGARPESGGEMVDHLRKISDEIDGLEEIHQDMVQLDAEMAAFLQGQRGPVTAEQQAAAKALQDKINGVYAALPGLTDAIKMHLGAILAHVQELGLE